MHVYFSGIGGTGLSPLAHLALDCGYFVSGSDGEESQNTTDLLNRGCRVVIGQSLSEIEALHQKNPIDWVVATSALPSDHPHIVFAKKNNIKISKRYELINLIIKEKNLKMIAVAGTHGKTTTVGMLVWVFKQLNIPVSYLVGSNISFGRSGEFASGSEYFVYECDEFDKNFLNFEPYLSIIPSLDYDHPDTYPSILDYVEAFVQFIGHSKNIVTWESVKEYICKFVLVDYTNSKYSFLKQGEFDKFQNGIKLEGETSRKNAFLVVFGLSKILKIDSENLFNVVSSFPGTQRRFENLSNNLYSDYGHHPIEILATLQKAKEIAIANKQKIVLVYQPHQNIRQYSKEVQRGYQKCFEQANIVYWLPTYLSRENQALKVKTPDEILQKSGINKDPKFNVCELNLDLANKIKTHLKDCDLVLVMGAGSIDLWARKMFVKN
jgi:UDP-N-acetylmuramate--alanine ligase